MSYLTPNYIAGETHVVSASAMFNKERIQTRPVLFGNFTVPLLWQRSIFHQRPSTPTSAYAMGMLRLHMQHLLAGESSNDEDESAAKKQLQHTL